MSRDHSYPDQHLERPSFFFHPHPQSRLSKRGTAGSGQALGSQCTTYMGDFLACSLGSFHLCPISLTIQTLG